MCRSFQATAFIFYQKLLSLSRTFLFFFVALFELSFAVSRDSLFRIAYSPRLVNSFLISFCNLLFSKFSSEYSHTHARIFMQNFFIFHPLCLCMPLLSLCLDQRTNVILPRLSRIVNVVFISCAIQNILTSIQHAFANGTAEHPLPFAFPFPFSFSKSDNACS